MVMTPSSFTGDETYDKLVDAYLVVRIIVSTIISTLCFAQIYYEHQFIRYKYKKYTVTSRLLVLIGLASYPIFRILYSAVLFKTHDFDYGSVVVYLGMWTTFFLFQSWIFVACFWLQLLYTFFISRSIRLENKKRIWRLTWALWVLVLIYTVGYSIISKVSLKYTPTFYTAGFLVLLVAFGTLFAVNIAILSRQMKLYRKKGRESSSVDISIGGDSNNGKQDSSNNQVSDSMKTSIRKIKYLGAALVATIVCVLIRDLIFYVIIKVPMNDNSRHASSVITFTFETLQGIILMYAIAEKPSNYFLFRNVTPGRLSSSSPSSISGSSRGNRNQSGHTNNSNSNGIGGGGSYSSSGVNNETNSSNSKNRAASSTIAYSNKSSGSSSSNSYNAGADIEQQQPTNNDQQQQQQQPNVIEQQPQQQQNIEMATIVDRSSTITISVSSNQNASNSDTNV